MTHPHTEYDDAEIKRRQEAWTRAKEQAQADQFNRVPDGAYQVTVDRAEIKETRDGRPMLSLGLKIISISQGSGRYLWHNRLLDAEAQWPWLARDLAVLGVEVAHPDPEILRQGLPRMLDINLDVTVRTKGEYQNVYINGRIDGPAPTGSDLPF